MTNDENVLRMLAGANFAPGSKVILPSGKEIDGNEAQALTSFYAPTVDDRKIPEPAYEPTESEMVLRRVQQQVQRWREEADRMSDKLPISSRHKHRLMRCVEDMEAVLKTGDGF